MKLSTYISNLDQLNELIRIRDNGGGKQIDEVIISPMALSPLGILTSRQVVECAEAAHKAGFKVFLEWDDLVKENKFEGQSKFFNSQPLNLFDAIRVKDLGIAKYVNGHPDVKNWHFITGYGNRNLAALKNLQEYFSPKLVRFVCSTEIPKEILKTWKQVLKLDIEIQIFGKILIFFSIRPLISIQSEVVKKGSIVPVDEVNQEKMDEGLFEYWQASAESEESSQKKFFFHENHLGTSMFLPKELSLLSEYPELKDLGINAGRIDLRFEDRFAFLDDVIQVLRANTSPGEIDLENNAVQAASTALKEKYPAPLITGFFHANRTDRRFKHLKNTLLHRSGPNYLGEVKEVVSGSHITVQLAARSRLPKMGTTIGYLNPEGKEGAFVLSEAWDATGKAFESDSHQRLVVLPHQGKVTARTQLYVKEL